MSFENLPNSRGLLVRGQKIKCQNHKAKRLAVFCSPARLCPALAESKQAGIFGFWFLVF